MIYTYTFVVVPAKIGASRSAAPAYQETINEYAVQGWRFVQLVVENPAAVSTEYVLIFERPVP